MNIRVILHFLICRGNKGDYQYFMGDHPCYKYATFVLKHLDFMP